MRSRPGQNNKMIGGRLTALLLALASPVTILALGGCPGTPPPAADVHVPTADDLSLGPGDMFEVRVFGEPDLSGAYRLGEDGTIDYPLVGQIKLQGLDSHAAADEIARRLAEKYIRKPQVSLLIREQNSKKVNVLGQVQKPGNYPFSSGMTILDALSVAGGFTPIAAKDKVSVTRVVDGKQVTFEVNAAAVSEGKVKNFALRPGDAVNVHERLF